MENTKSTYDERHGGPLDRGRADAWYNREYNPHYFKGATYDSEKVELANMTAGEIAAYTHGYEEQISTGLHK
jgi:hypothetical protein